MPIRVPFAFLRVLGFSCRSQGYGDALFDWLTVKAREEGCATLELESGTHRHDAHRFYLRKRMRISSYHFSVEALLLAHLTGHWRYNRVGVPDMKRRRKTSLIFLTSVVGIVAFGIVWTLYQSTPMPTETPETAIEPGGPQTAEPTGDYAHPPRPQSQEIHSSATISEIPPPTGFSRMPLPASSFGTWLRSLPLRTGQTEVLLFDGTPKLNQSAHFAILDIDVGPRDLQQCADAVIRLRAEYLFSSECPDAIQFNFTSGDTARWNDWRDGMRPRIAGNQVTWNRTAAPDSSYDNFRDYLDSVFTYAGSASLERELSPVSDLFRPEVGDVFIRGGYPGHAVIVVDVAENLEGLRVFLLAQSFMPAQDLHVLKSFDNCGPWYYAESEGMLHTPEWDFAQGDLRRFLPAPCESTRAAAG